MASYTASIVDGIFTSTNTDVESGRTIIQGGYVTVRSSSDYADVKLGYGALSIGDSNTDEYMSLTTKYCDLSSQNNCYYALKAYSTGFSNRWLIRVYSNTTDSNGDKVPRGTLLFNSSDESLNMTSNNIVAIPRLSVYGRNLNYHNDYTFPGDNPVAVFNGDIIVSGTINPTTSDIAIKDISPERPDCIEKLKSMGDVVSFNYRQENAYEIGIHDPEVPRVGLIYQNVKDSGIYGFTGKSNNGYGYINYLSSDYQAILLGAVQQLIKRVETLEEKVKNKT